MKVTKYKKKKDGLYEVELNNNETLFLYEETILNNDVLTKGITDINRVIEENEKYEVYYKALKIIKARIKSRKEIVTKLRSLNYKNEDIDWAISKLEEQGYISDLRYASSYLNDKLITTSYGPYKIANELKKKGIADLIINDTLINYTEEMQVSRIEKIINRIIKSNRTRSGLMLKKKILMDLINMGYDRELCSRKISEYDIVTDSKILKQEYDKLYKKLSRKYSGHELEMIIKKKMYEKGFTTME